MVNEWMKSVQFASLTESERYQVIAGSGRRFRFGRTTCEDGYVRWTVDFDYCCETSEVSSMYARGSAAREKNTVRSTAVEA